MEISSLKSNNHCKLIPSQDELIFDSKCFAQKITKRDFKITYRSTIELIFTVLWVLLSFPLLPWLKERLSSPTGTFEFASTTMERKVDHTNINWNYVKQDFHLSSTT